MGQVTGDASLTFKWSYGETSSTNIPTSNQYLFPLALSSPYTFLVEAQATCGDGVIASSETWDDGNTISGDGCNSSCAIESNAVCSYQSSISKSVCKFWDVSCTPNSLKSECVVDEIHSAIPPFASFYITFLWVGIFVNFLLSKYFKYSTYGIYIMFNHFQMFMLTPLIGGYIPKLVIDFYGYMYGLIFNFGFIFDWSVFINFGKNIWKV